MKLVSSKKAKQENRANPGSCKMYSKLNFSDLLRVKGNILAEKMEITDKHGRTYNNIPGKVFVLLTHIDVSRTTNLNNQK